MAFAGLWERCRFPDGQIVRSFAIVVGEPNELVAPIHNRMPVIVHARDCAAWLGEEAADPARLTRSCSRTRQTR
jgi:putative SOS response-associated peptidase YedK